MNKDTAIIIPCYNESKRIHVDSFIRYMEEHENIIFYFVNDGSNDNTIQTLERIRSQMGSSVEILDLPKNQGKAEAVRQGMLCAISKENPFQYFGYWDADLATPLEEIGVFVDYMYKNENVLWVSGARIKKGGCDIKRSPYRHYLGRIFVTIVNLMLSIEFYDTQCGAKVVKRTIVKNLFGDPFISKWIFDLELIIRLRNSPKFVSNYVSVLEKPLEKWEDVSGSKVKATTFFKALVDVIKIYYKTRITKTR